LSFHAGCEFCKLARCLSKISEAFLALFRLETDRMRNRDSVSFGPPHQRTLSTSGISRVLEYSIRSSTEYSSSKKLDLHSPSQITEKREDWNQSVYRVDGRQIGRIFSFVVTYVSAFERYVYQYLSNCFLPIIFRLLHIHRLIFWFKEKREFEGEERVTFFGGMLWKSYRKLE